MAKSIVVLITKPPYGGEDAFAGLRQAMAFMASGALKRVGVVFIGEGVYNLASGQKSASISMPSNFDTLEDLNELGAELYASQPDVERHLAGLERAQGWKPVSDNELAILLEGFDLTTTF